MYFVLLWLQLAYIKLLRKWIKYALYWELVEQEMGHLFVISPILTNNESFEVSIVSWVQETLVSCQNISKTSSEMNEYLSNFMLKQICNIIVKQNVSDDHQNELL